jgi:excisionase family DNA binding protein
VSIADDKWPEFLKVKEVAGILRVSTMTVYRLLREGELESTRARKGIRIYADSVRRLLKT